MTASELTAADVVYSLRRILDPDVNSPRRHEFSELDQIVAVDALTVRIITKRPYVLLPARLSQFSMILPDQLRGRSDAEFFRDPIGLGPFRLTELGPQQAVLTAFADYHGGAPKVPRVVFEFIADPEERLRQTLAGSVDIVTNVLPQQVDSLVRARGVRLVKRHSIRFMNVFIDTRRGPLARTEVRQALLHATDAEGLVRYVARGNGRPLATVTLPEDFGYNGTLKTLSLRSGEGQGSSDGGGVSARVPPAGPRDARDSDRCHCPGPAVGEDRRDARCLGRRPRSLAIPSGSRNEIDTTS